MQETWAWSLGWEDPREKEMATHSSILAWRISWTEEPGGLQPTGSQESGMTEWLTYYRGHMASVVLCQVFVVHRLQDGSKRSQSPGIQTFAYFPPTFYRDCDQSVVVQSLNCVRLFATPCTVARSLLCPPPSPRVCSNSCLLSWWYYLTISSSGAAFFCFQSVPTSGSFPVSWLFASGGQSTGASASASVLPMNI